MLCWGLSEECNHQENTDNIECQFTTYVNNHYMAIYTNPGLGVGGMILEIQRWNGGAKVNAGRGGVFLGERGNQYLGKFNIACIFLMMP